MPLEVGGALRFRLEGEDRGRKSEIRGHPSSPYGLRRDKEDRRQMASAFAKATEGKWGMGITT